MRDFATAHGQEISFQMVVLNCVSVIFMKRPVCLRKFDYPTQVGKQARGGVGRQGGEAEMPREPETRESWWLAHKRNKVLALETKGHGNDQGHQQLKPEHEPKGRGGGGGWESNKLPLKGKGLQPSTPHAWGARMIQEPHQEFCSSSGQRGEGEWGGGVSQV